MNCAKITLNEARLEATRDRIEVAVLQRTTELTQQTEVLRQTSEQLRESEEGFISAFDAAAIGMTLEAMDGHWLQGESSDAQNPGL